jgi:hypothetical protein
MQPTPNMNIPPNDLILSFGSDQRAKLPASSQVLSVASHVFAAMFSNNFAEGQTLFHLTPKEVELAEDDPESMCVIISILHHRNCDVPLSLDIDRILSIATVADKYDLSAALRWAATCWFRSCTRNSLGICVTLSIAAYMLNLQAEFRNVTSRLVLDHNWTVGGLLTLMDREAIPSATLLRGICK